MIIGSAVANAAAFIGGNALYGLVNKSGADEERVRHDKALEDVQKAQVEWSQKRQVRLDYLNDRLQREHDVEKDYADTNEAMRLYYEVTGGDEEKLKNIPAVGDVPSLEEFYQPSEAQKNYELVFLAGGIGLSAWLAFNFL